MEKGGVGGGGWGRGRLLGVRGNEGFEGRGRVGVREFRGGGV